VLLAGAPDGRLFTLRALDAVAEVELRRLDRSLSPSLPHR